MGMARRYCSRCCLRLCRPSRLQQDHMNALRCSALPWTPPPPWPFDRSQIPNAAVDAFPTTIGVVDPNMSGDCAVLSPDGSPQVFDNL